MEDVLTYPQHESDCRKIDASIYIPGEWLLAGALRCPECGAECSPVLDTAIVCHNRQCDWRAGDAADLMDRKGVSYADFEKHPHFPKALATTPGKWARVRASRRRAFLSIVSAMSHLPEDILKMRLAEKTAYQHIKALSSKRQTAFVTTRDDLTAKVLALGGTPEDIPPFTKRALVFPAFESFLRVGAFMVVDLHTDPRCREPVGYVTVGDATWTWIGLLDTDNHMGFDMLVTSSLQGMLENHAQASSADAGTAVFPLYCNGSSPAKSPVPGNAVFNLHDLSGAPLAFEISKAIGFPLLAEDGLGPPAEVAEVFKRSVLYALKSGFDVRLRGVLSCRQIPRAVRLELAEELKLRGFLQASEFLTQASQSEPIYEHGRNRLFETPEGYAFSTYRLSERSRATNFTVEVLSTSIFSDTRDVVHNINLHGDDGSVRAVSLKPEATVRSSEFEKFLCAEVLDQNPESDWVPRILDDRPYKAIQSYLKNEFSRKDVKNDQAACGWSDAGTVFRGPSWFADSTGVFLKPRASHPDYREILCYGPGHLPEAPMVQDPVCIWKALKTSAKDRNVLAVLYHVAGMLCEWVATEDGLMAPIPLTTDARAAACFSVLKSLGFDRTLQWSVVRKLEKRKAAQSFFRGMPAVVQGATLSYLRGNLRRSCFYAADDSSVIRHGLITQTEIHPGAVNSLVASVATMVARGQHPEMELRRSIDRWESLAQYGSRVVRALWDGFPEFKCHVSPIDEFLELIDVKGNPSDAVKHDLMRQVVCFKLGDFSKDDLHLALRAVCSNVEDCGDVLEVDAVSGVTLLQDFFGNDVKIQTTGVVPAEDGQPTNISLHS